MPPAKEKTINVDAIFLAYKGKNDPVTIDFPTGKRSFSKDDLRFTMEHFGSLLAWPNVVYRDTDTNGRTFVMWVDDGALYMVDSLRHIDEARALAQWIKFKAAVERTLK